MRTTCLRIRRLSIPGADPVWTKQRGEGGRPTATHHHVCRQRTPRAAHGHCRARNDMAATQSRCGRQRQRCQPELISGARASGWCATGASSYRLDTCKVAAVARDVLLSDNARGGMTRC
eukprot:scaffold97023_cov48-Phaeocystis_antarctica.AAC.2